MAKTLTTKKKVHGKEWLEHYEAQRLKLTERTLLARVKANIAEAEAEGLLFDITYEPKSDLYTISVDGERGSVTCTLRRLPAMLNGLRVMGAKVREIFWRMHKKG